MAISRINGTGTVQNQIVGIVELVNDGGIKIGGAWMNYSKFAPDLVPPQRGQRVTAQLDKSGFVRSIAAADAVSTTGNTVPTKDVLIVRQCVVKAAAAFCASRPDLKSSDLLALAERLEAWVTR